MAGGEKMGKKYNVLLALMALEIGGAETHGVELANGLAKQGFNVIIASAGGVYEKELLSHGIKHYNVPLNNKKVNNVFHSYKILMEIIKQEKIDIIHAHARIPAFICNSIHKKTGVPFMTTAHGVFSTKWGLKYITKWGNKTIAVSDDIKDYLISNYKINKNSIKVSINGIDTERFSNDIDYSDIINKFSITPDLPKILHVSRLDSDRSDVAHMIIDIAPELLKRGVANQTIIVGDGNDFNRLNEKAEQINKKLGQRAIIMTGARTDINKFTAMCDLFVGVSRAALEAMAASKPVILASVDGYMGVFEEQNLQTAIQNNFTCRGEEKTSESRLTDDIQKILNEKDIKLLNSLGEFGRKVVENEYSVKKMVKDNIDMYLELLK